MSREESCRVAPEQLRWRCDPAVFGVTSTRELEPAPQVIGQERALRALKLGIEVGSPGYNVYVSGLSGTGRLTAVKRLLEGLSTKCVDVPDKAYVNNFEDPARPLLLLFPRGQLCQFKEALGHFIRELRARLSALFEDEEYVRQRRTLEEAFEEEQRARFDELSEECRLAGLALIQRKEGPLTRPTLAIPIGKELFPLQAMQRLVAQGKLEKERVVLLELRAKELSAKLDSRILDARRAMRELEEQVIAFDQDQARATFQDELAELKERFPEEAVVQHLERIELAIVEAVHLFAPSAEGRQEQVVEEFLHHLDINPILDNADREDTPVLVEAHPDFTNLFGTVEYRVSPSGEVRTDHMQVRAGSLVKADGGYLILSADDVLSQPPVWQTLKRVLKTRQLELQARAGLFGPAPLLFKPEPIPLQVKVILIGNARMYAMLHAFDPDFAKTFKVRADFDSEMDRTDDNIRRYAAFVRNLGEEEGLLPFDASALVAVTEAGARLADHGGKLSTRFADIADLTREAQHFAVAEGAGEVTHAHVHQALHEARARDDLYDAKLKERIHEHSILIDTEEERVGQVNALTVFQSGRFSFGKPARITATLSAGDHGIVNVEREVNLSGDIHDKGVLILSGFLRERFGQHHPLTLAASIVFEQNYAGVDGDSASSTELYALLSALADVPLHQSLAVTGSVNQKGDIQPIGGVNEKIEGFFEICRDRGLTGRHGALIPHQNVRDLMLPEEIIDAVKAGKFHLYAISHIDEGIELLTGVPAGEPDAEGHYPPDSINGRAAARLAYLAEVSREKAPTDGGGAAAAPDAPEAPGAPDTAHPGAVG